MNMRVIKALAAVIMLAALLAGPPWLLLHFIGNPWPEEGISLSAPLTDGAIIGLLAAMVWVLWGQLVVCIVVEAIAALTDDRFQPRAPLTFGVQQQLARRLVSAVVVALVATPLAAGGAATAAEPAAHTHAAAATSISSASTDHQGDQQGGQGKQPAHESHAAAAATSSQHAPDQKNRRTSTTTVMRLDSLWSIAERVLDDGERWPEIAALNEGEVMNDGTKFISADHIRPGWKLAVPGTTADNLHEPGHGDVEMSHVVVEPGDTLSEIAQDELGDASAFPRVFDASTSITQPGGRHLSDPNLIDVGWTLSIPGTAAQPSSAGDHDGGINQGEKQGVAGAEHGGHDGATGGPRTKSEEAPADGSWDRSSDASPEVPDDELAAGEGVAAPHEQGDAPWMLAGLAGGGLVLAGSLLLGLRARRRAQFRSRRPGRAVAVLTEALAAVEKSITTSTTAAATVEHMDNALRRLAAWSARERSPMPALAAVELAGGSMVLHLSAPASLPAPWQDTAGDRLHWSAAVDQTDRVDELAEAMGGVGAPYPLLVTVGSTTTGNVWLLNCEELAEIRISGDTTRGQDFARYLVAELAMNPWSELARVDCIGIAAEVAPMNPDRVGHHPASSLAETAAATVAHAVTTIDRATSIEGDPVTGRTGQLDDDVWPARLVVVDASALNDPEHDDGHHTVHQLRELIRSHPGRTSTAVLLVGDQDPEVAQSQTTAVEVLVHGNGQLSVAAVGLELLAVGLSAEEARGCAALLTQSEDLEDLDIPVNETADHGWEAYADETGALRRDYTVPRETAPEDLEEPVGSILDAAEEAYVREAAVTPDDLQALAPQVPVRLRGELDEADPGLDQDVADWFDDNCVRPRLALLGPVTARAHGKPLEKRKPYFTELLAYLTLRRRNGIAAAEVADAFNIEVSKARGYVNIVRDWLGINPTTGTHYLPHAHKSRASQASGVPVYQVDQDVMVDVELFRRLRVRGQARGAEGIADLRRALLLVSGRPFDHLREGGWSWLIDGERIDQYMSFAVADVAFLVTTHCLEQGEIQEARSAAEIGTLAAPDEEATRLSLARVFEAEGDRAEAERIVREEVCNRSDDGGAPTDLSDRTQTIIGNRAWLTNQQAAS